MAVSRKIVTTRKPHRCIGCDRIMPIGSKMECTVVAACGEIRRVYECEVCTEVCELVKDRLHEDGYTYGELREFDEWEVTRKQIEG